MEHSVFFGSFYGVSTGPTTFSGITMAFAVRLTNCITFIHSL